MELSKEASGRKLYVIRPLWDTGGMQGPEDRCMEGRGVSPASLYDEDRLWHFWIREQIKHKKRM